MSELNTLSLTPSEDLLRFAERDAIRSLAEKPANERRVEQRIPLIVPVLLQPVTDQVVGLDEPFAAVSRNITRTGFTVIAERWKSHNMFVVRVSAEGHDYTLLAEEKWRRPDDRYMTAGLRVVKQLKDQAFPLEIAR